VVASHFFLNPVALNGLYTWVESALVYFLTGGFRGEVGVFTFAYRLFGNCPAVNFLSDRRYDQADPDMDRKPMGPTRKRRRTKGDHRLQPIPETPLTLREGVGRTVCPVLTVV
jgi:hypothetical protein